MMNIILPIVTGVILYYILSPNVLFLKIIHEILGLEFLLGTGMHNSSLIVAVRNYMADMLWAYALTFSLFIIFGNKTAGLWRIFMTSFIFSSVMELLQLTSFVKGTFDILDILTEMSAELVAVFIIKKHFMRRKL